MNTTVSLGKLKIIEANVRGLNNKEEYVKKFLKRKKQKPDVFCIVEHKTMRNESLLIKFSSGSYRVGASHCRGTCSGGVALLVHESVGQVEDLQNKFENEFARARERGVEIAGIFLNLKAEGCNSGLFVFGIYRQTSLCTQPKILCDIICELSDKVKTEHNATALFMGDFNFNNNSEAQRSRDNKYWETISLFKNSGYKFTHKKPSHQMGSCLNNFLVPLQLKYTQKTIYEGFKIPKEQRRSSPREPDHSPIQLVVTLDLLQGKTNLLGPSTSTRGEFSEEILISKSNDEVSRPMSGENVVDKQLPNIQHTLASYANYFTLARIKTGPGPAIAQEVEETHHQKVVTGNSSPHECTVVDAHASVPSTSGFTTCQNLPPSETTQNKSLSIFEVLLRCQSISSQLSSSTNNQTSQIPNFTRSHIAIRSVENKFEARFEGNQGTRFNPYPLMPAPSESTIDLRQKLEEIERRKRQLQILAENEYIEECKAQILKKIQERGNSK